MGTEPLTTGMVAGLVTPRSDDICTFSVFRSYKGRFASKFGDAKSEFLNYLFFKSEVKYDGALRG